VSNIYYEAFFVFTTGVWNVYTLML